MPISLLNVNFISPIMFDYNICTNNDFSVNFSERITEIWSFKFVSLKNDFSIQYYINLLTNPKVMIL